MGWIKSMIMNWLNVQPAPNITVTIVEPYSFEGNVLKNRIWYRGDPSELSQFYKQTKVGPDDVADGRFWAAVPSFGLQIRKIHSGLPGMIVDKIADIVSSDMQQIEFDETDTLDSKERWEDIALENEFEQLVRDAIAQTDITGDGAFKISFDPAISSLPILEFYSGERVDYTQKRGRTTEILFYTPLSFGDRSFKLEEVYGAGYVKYNMYDSNGNCCNVNDFEGFENLVPIEWNDKFMLAVPLMFFKSPKYDCRGRSIFEGKCDVFDAFDEDLSQWTQAFRDGRITKYIPEDLLPTDPDTGVKMNPNPFDNQFIKVLGSMNEDGSKIDVSQPQINSSAFSSKYTTDLDLCLQGIISPSTLGIDVKKMDNAESQREKEKTTMYSRAQRIKVLEKVLPKLVESALKAEDLYKNNTPQEYKCFAAWGEYANPSFEAVVETVSKARQSNIMSIEMSIEQLYGNSMSEDEKEIEVNLIKNELGIATVQEPSVGDPMASPLEE